MSLFKSASTVSLFTLLSRVTGLARELLIASSFGASAMTDAFNVAFRIPNLFRRLFAEGAFDAAFVPLFAKRFHGDGGEAAARAFAERLQATIAVPVELHDERFTTRIAARTGGTAAEDSRAAAVLLEDWLSRGRPEG